MWVHANLISCRDRKAEAVVHIGERSVTRHLVRKDGKWWGRNPDEPAIARLVAMEKVETATVEAFHEYNGKLEAITAKLQALKEAKIAARKEGIILDLRQLAGIEKGLRVDLKNLTPYVAGLGHAMKIAKESADALRKTTPALVEFVF